MTDTGAPLRTFFDADLESAFLRDGFVVCDLVDRTTIDSLLAAYHELDSGIDEGYYPSLMSADVEYKERTHATVRDLLWPRVSTVIDGFSPLLGVFMVKHPGPDTEVPPHQDWIVADESERQTMNAWVPLVDVTPEMGQMRVLPGSHRWLEGLRGSPTFPTQWEAVHRRVRDELMEPVEVPVGQALIYDIRLLHGTPPNLSGETRVVSSIYGIPEGSSSIHYYRDPDGTVSGYRVPMNFCTVFNIGDVPMGEKFVEIPDYAVDVLTFEEIESRYLAERRSVGALV
jgi:hypothetical protein